MTLIGNNSLIFEPKRPEVGDVVMYTLLPSQRPVNPKRVWQGKVISLASDGVFVELLEPEYVGLSEYVRTIQYVSVTKPK